MTDWITEIQTHDPQAIELIERQEMAWVAAMDGDQVRDLKRVAQGGCTRVEVHLPPVLAVPIMAGVDHFTLLHNHPSGRLRVSEEDKRLTRLVLDAATVCGLTLVDHVIVTRVRFMSLVDHRILEAAPVVGLAAHG